MLSVRRARPDEADVLTELAVRSESYWGYDSEYMERFRSTYAVSADYIISSPAFVLQDDERVVGFCGLLLEADTTSLEYFFIEPGAIGKGYGRVLWFHLLSQCRRLGITAFSIVTSPQAQDFYTKMGATLIGETESLLRQGRRIPQLTCTVEPSQLPLFTRHVGAYGLCRRNQDVLLVRKARGPYAGRLDLPGGGIEDAESPVQALWREFAEEAGFSPADVHWLREFSHTCVYTNSSGKLEVLHHLGFIWVVQPPPGAHPKDVADGEDSLGAAWYDVRALAADRLSPLVVAALAASEDRQ